MNLLRLSRYLLSKRLLHEIILLVQLVLMVIFAFSVLNPIDTFQHQVVLLCETYQLDFDDTIHFASGNAIIQSEWEGDYSYQDTLYEKIASVSQVKDVIRCYYGDVSFYSGMNQEKPMRSSANLIVYSEEMAQVLNLNLSAGSFTTNAKSALPIVVSASLAEQFPIGTEKEIVINQTGRSISCVVSGILDADSIIPIISTYGSNPALDVFAAFPENTRGADFIVASYNEGYMGDIAWGSNYLITIDQSANTTDTQAALISEVGSYGTVQTVSQVIQESFDSMLQGNRWNIFATVLLGLIALFGYGGYLYLMIRQRQTEFAVFYLLGMTRRQMATIIFIAGGAVLVLAIAIGSCVAPWFMQNILFESETNPGITSYLFCGILLFAILTGSVAVGFNQSVKNTTAALYQGGD